MGSTGLDEIMTQAITRCPACGMSFRISESQLRIADGAVRCGACLHVFQAEEYFVSPMLDATERIAIEQEYWSHFEAYLFQVASSAEVTDAVPDPEPADHDDELDEAQSEPEDDWNADERAAEPDEYGVQADFTGSEAAVQNDADLQTEADASTDALTDEGFDVESDEARVEDHDSDEDLRTSAVGLSEVEVLPDDFIEPDYDLDDVVPILSQEIPPEEFEEAFAMYADVGLVPIDTVPLENVGQRDLFAPNTQSPSEAELAGDADFEALAGSPASFEETADASADETLMDFYLDYLDHHPGIAVESPGIAADGAEQDTAFTTGLTIIETRDEPPESELDSPAFNIESDPDELTAPRQGGITNAMIGWFVASLAMLGIGLLQYVFYNMDSFSQHERYRPWYITTCRYLGCELPEYDKIELLKTRELIVRTHPSETDALTVDVLLSNNGDFRQLFPGLRLTFFDLDGEKTASRVFTVKEYLGGELRGLRFIPARTEVRLSLELVDPGNEALGYEMQVVPI